MWDGVGVSRLGRGVVVVTGRFLAAVGGMENQR